MANVDFIRGNEQKINDTPIVDGQLLFDTDNETILMDNGTKRQNFGGGKAENVSYDNTTSGLEGTNLQATTDEIADDLKRVPAVTDAIEDVGDIAGRDADTLGGRITASNIDTMQNEINEINGNLAKADKYLGYGSNIALGTLINNNISNMKQFVTYTFHVDNIQGTPFPTTNQVIVKVIVVNEEKTTYNVEVSDTTSTKTYYINRLNGTWNGWSSSLDDKANKYTTFGKGVQITSDMGSYTFASDGVVVITGSNQVTVRIDNPDYSQYYFSQAKNGNSFPIPVLKGFHLAIATLVGGNDSIFYYPYS